MDADEFERRLQAVRYALVMPQGDRIELPTAFVVELLARYDERAPKKRARLSPTSHSLISVDEDGCHWIDGRFGGVRRLIRCGTLEEAKARLAALR